MISSGVISEPPPIPVRPTRAPTPRPKMTIIGSIARAAEGTARQLVEAALRLVGVGPAALTPGVGRKRAVRAADRGVAAIVQLVVRHVIGCDVVPHVALRPVRQRV